MADVPIGTANTPQAFLGNWVGWLCLSGLILFVLSGPNEKIYQRRQAHQFENIHTAAHTTKKTACLAMRQTVFVYRLHLRL